MKNISSIICNGVLIVSLLFLVNYLQANDWGNKEYIVASVVVAGCAYGIYYVSTSALGSYHLNAMNKARMAIDKNKCTTYENGSEDEKVISQLEEYKKNLSEKWIFSYDKGLTISGTINYSGSMTIANIFCFYLNLSGHGYLNNAVVGSSTNLDGDFITENSRLGTVDLNYNTQFSSFNNCLLGDIKSKNGIILELEKSVVDGNIVFDQLRPGVVVIDKESIIKGSLVNGRLVKNRSVIQ